MLRNGEIAPAFALKDNAGEERTLASIATGRSVLLLFFRGAFCPTARRDLARYNDVYGRVRGVNAEMVGVSADTPEELRSLRERLELGFPLLSDPGMEASARYGV